MPSEAFMFLFDKLPYILVIVIFYKPLDRPPSYHYNFSKVLEGIA